MDEWYRHVKPISSNHSAPGTTDPLETLLPPAERSAPEVLPVQPEEVERGVVQARLAGQQRPKKEQNPKAG